MLILLFVFRYKSYIVIIFTYLNYLMSNNNNGKILGMFILTVLMALEGFISIKYFVDRKMPSTFVKCAVL